MTLKQAIKYLKKNVEIINYSGIAEQLEMDASNFHKVVKGKLGLSDDKLKRLEAILGKLGYKNTL